VQFCDCNGDEEEQKEYYQLLDAELFPASFVIPQTVFTFEVLDMLLVLSNIGRTSTYDFHQSLRSLSDNCELHGWPVCLSISITSISLNQETEAIR
jgi:hypothetical protein